MRQGSIWDWAAQVWSWGAWVGDRPHPGVYLGPPVPLWYPVVGFGAGNLDHCAAVSFSTLACMTSSACCRQHYAALKLGQILGCEYDH